MWGTISQTGGFACFFFFPLGMLKYDRLIDIFLMDWEGISQPSFTLWWGNTITGLTQRLAEKIFSALPTPERYQK